MRSFGDIASADNLSFAEKANACVLHRSDWTSVDVRKDLEIGAIVFAILAVGEQISLASQDQL